MTTTTAEVLVTRIGDQDDYHECTDLYELAELLTEHGVTDPLHRYCEYGMNCEGFSGWNYISLYWGTDTETPTRELTDDDLRTLNTLLSETNQ